ncbi:MAG: tetratricopeptide repeat protein [Capsulimonadaceae bacterium]|nr:tetratricopeptide repeat protein [Capsulimonadaceae bacterium]
MNDEASQTPNQDFAAGAGATRKRQRGHRLPALVLLAITALVYGAAITYKFVTWDDGIHVFKNPYFHPLTWSNVAHFWLAPYEKLYIPLSYTVYAALVVIANHFPTPFDQGTDATIDAHVFHIASVGVHLLNTFLVFLIAKRLTRRALPAAVGTLIFAIHPMQVESVAWVSELRGLLAALFCLIAMLIYVRLGDEAGNSSVRLSKCWIRCGALMVLALLCKPSVLILPIALLTIGCLFQKRPLLVCARETLPLLALSLPFLVITHAAQPVLAQVSVPWLERPLIAADALAFYITKLFAPFRLCIDYSRRPHDVLGHWWGYVTWILPVAVAWTAWRFRDKAPYLLAGAALFAVVLLPELGLVPFTYQNYSTVADRYAYLALLGPAFALSILVARLDATTLWNAAIALTAVLGLLAVHQSGVWRNSLDLNAACLAVNPNSAACHANYGDALYRCGRYAQARDEFLESIKANPDFEYLYTDLGDVYLALHSYDDAVNCYTYAAFRNPDNPVQHDKLARALLAAKRYDEAIHEFTTTISLSPHSKSAFIGLGDACAGAQRWPDAVLAYRGAIFMGDTGAQTQRKLKHAIEAAK